MFMYGKKNNLVAQRDVLETSFGHRSVSSSSPVELQVFSGPVQEVQESVHYFILTDALRKK